MPPCVQEEEVNFKKRQLEVLVEEEAKLGSDLKKSQNEIEYLMKTLTDVETLIAEVRLLDYLARMNYCCNLARNDWTHDLKA